MTVTLLKSSFSAGELSPSVWGRVTAQTVQQGAAVMRNCFVSRRGPASSRAGTSLVGLSLTPAGPGRLPPVLIRFQFSIFQSYVLEFGVDGTGPYLRVVANGGYVTEAPVAATAATATDPVGVTVPGNTFAVGDSVFASGFRGMTQLNGRSFTVAAAGATVTLNDIWGHAVDGTGFAAYTGGGSLARIYTNRQVPYALEDLPYLKVVQSADVMTLTCVNQETGSEYPPSDLSRFAPDNFQFSVTNFGAKIAAPASVAAVPTTNVQGADNGNHFVPAAQYAYVVTAVDKKGEESIASPVAYTPIDSANNASVDMSITAGGEVVTWAMVPGALSYNIYRAPAVIWNTGSDNHLPPGPVPIGSIFGFVGTAVGNQFQDQNIVPDWTTTPPLHLNPFSRGQIEFVQVTAAGSGYTQANTSVVINTTTGSGAVILPVIDLIAGPAGPGGTIAGFIVQNPGGGYQPGDTVTIVGDGSGATATLEIGPQTGTYPGVCGYFQTRRVYAATLNDPDTMWFSQTGAYTNMDAGIPPIDTDAIVLTPWGQQVNTIQWLQPMPGGLLACTGLDTWQVVGQGGGVNPTLTPSSESATPQESNGFTPLVPPIRANYDVLFVQELGYSARDIQFNFFTNIYAGQDLSVLSNHLFEGFQINGWAWARIPWQMVWACRSDGKALSLTYDKELQLAGWARHDTDGLFMRTAVATEPPVDAPYFVVQRYIPGVNRWVYFIERMDNRFWDGPEEPWCIDCGLELGQERPDAALSAAAAAGPGTITGGYLATGGQGYTTPTVNAVDPTGAGSGFAMTLTLTDGAVTGFAITNPGSGYSPATQVVISDPVGDGATFVALISQNVLFTASAPLNAFSVGAVIRIGGGKAQITSVISRTQVLAQITAPIIKTMPNDPARLPVPANPGEWTIATPVTTVTGLEHLEGKIVTGLADGEVIAPQQVINGQIELAAPASAIKVGLGFTAQLQALHLEEPSQGTIQGRRKRISGATVRMEKTRGMAVGANQPVASALDFQQEIAWRNLADVPELPVANLPAGALPLFSGDKFVRVDDDWQNFNGFEAAPGMIAAQQSLPLPMSVTALVPTFETGDTPG